MLLYRYNHNILYVYTVWNICKRNLNYIRNTYVDLIYVLHNAFTYTGEVRYRNIKYVYAVVHILPQTVLYVLCNCYYFFHCLVIGITPKYNIYWKGITHTFLQQTNIHMVETNTIYSTYITRSTVIIYTIVL